MNHMADQFFNFFIFASENGTTGMPKVFSNSLARTEPPFARTSSMICMVRYLFSKEDLLQNISFDTIENY